MNRIKDQVLASTHLDAHGERTPVETLRRLCKSGGTRMPLRFKHEFGRPPIGYIENQRVIEDPSSPGEWVLVGDVYFNSDDVDEALKGFSYSLTENFTGNMEGGHAAIYLPYPHYNNDEWVRSLCASDRKLTIGRWRQKNIEPTTALLVSLFLWLFRPAWQDAYDRILGPRIRSLLAQIPKLRAKGIKVNLVQNVVGPSGEEVRVMFFPEDDDVPTEQQILIGLIEVDRYFRGHSDQRAIEQISLHRDVGTGRYSVTHVEFVDGGDLYVA